MQLRILQASMVRKTRQFLNTTLNKQQEHSEVYSEKLQKLLDKIQVQNRYSNRITLTNLINLTKLQQVTKEMQSIKESRRKDELYQFQLKKANAELTTQLKLLKEQLDITALTLLDIKKEIKKQQQIIKKVEKQNINLQTAIFSLKRKSLQYISQYKLNIVEDLLQNQVKNFLVSVNWRESLLIQHCRACIERNNFNNFFMDLQNKIQSYMQIKNSMVCPRLVRSHSRKVYQSEIKSRLQKSIEASKKNSSRQNIPNAQQKKSLESSRKMHRRVNTVGPMRAW